MMSNLINLPVEPKFKIDILFGHCEIKAWVEHVNGKLIGMGSKKTYDQFGNLIGYSESPTGLTATFQFSDY